MTQKELILYAKQQNLNIKRQIDQSGIKNKPIELKNDVIKLDGIELPGVILSIDGDCEVEFDDATTAGESGSKKLIKGFSDSGFTVEIIFLNDKDENGKIINSKYDKLEKLNGIFKKLQGESVKIYKITNKHINSRGVENVLIKSMSSKESVNEFKITLNFIEHNPTINKVQTQIEQKPVIEYSKQTQDNNTKLKIRGFGNYDDASIKELQLKLQIPGYGNR